MSWKDRQPKIRIDKDVNISLMSLRFLILKRQNVHHVVPCYSIFITISTIILFIYCHFLFSYLVPLLLNYVLERCVLILHRTHVWHVKKLGSDLVEVQRGVITQGTDGSQFNQGIILGALHWFTILVPEDMYTVLMLLHSSNIRR